MKRWPRISIVTPSFNQAQFIGHTIESVLSQNYPNLEYIVMDGGSTDGTLEILKSYGRKIIYRSERDKGQGDAINKGLQMASGELLAYLNSDDTYQPSALIKTAEYFVENPEVVWAFGMCRIVDENDDEIRNIITSYKNFWLRRYNFLSLLVLDYISQPAVFWRKEAYEKIGGFDENEFYELDYDYWLRLGKRYQPGFIDEYLASFRVHKQAKTSANTKHFLEEIRVAKKYTNNPIIIGLHYLNFLSIMLGYSFYSRL